MGRGGQYGFISAGGGTWFTNTLKLLKPGGRIWVKVPGAGFVGVGRVKGFSTPLTEFSINVGGQEFPASEILADGQAKATADSLGLLVGHGIAVALDGSVYSHWIPYVDPALLRCMSLALLPVPLKTLSVTIRDVLEVAPKDLDRRMRSVLDALMRERGFLRYSSHVAQVGRVRFVEVHILVPADFASRPPGPVDDIRWEIAAWRLRGRKLGLPWI